MMSLSRRIGAVAAGSVALLAVAQPAMAATWYSQSDPLKVKEGGSTQGAAYGNYYNSNGSSAKNATTRKDYKAGGNGVYVDTDFYLYQYACSGGADGCREQWVYAGGDETGRTTSGKWVSETVSDALSAKASQSRGAIHVCEDQAYSGDPCSSWVYRSFSY
ncbi:hypothetical protein IFT73_06960 [Aeromicrobium sp. CFBP 8757]|uniref:hypothetical protein n=1 Tax=Aeromicrobium sp. CFBP 8757 TaxID=2775288 RepID=UPI00177F92E9|nr:hypothetical protein [Aeromicrobium sp. CFBP 8757]MBD8606591.1 hypothetical protein [Aeromicrobium sp. CFBP 8757]